MKFSIEDTMDAKKDTDVSVARVILIQLFQECVLSQRVIMHEVVDFLGNACFSF